MCLPSTGECARTFTLIEVARRARNNDWSESCRWITSIKDWFQQIKKIPAWVQQPRAYTKSCSIEPVDGARNNRFIVPFVPLSFCLISCSFVNVLARIQYKYARKLGSTVVIALHSLVRAVIINSSHWKYSVDTIKVQAFRVIRKQLESSWRCARTCDWSSSVRCCLSHHVKDFGLRS